MLLKVSDIVTRTSKKVNFHWRSAQPRPRPKLNSHDQRIVSQLRQEGVCSTTLEDLALPATSPMLAIADRLIEQLPQSESVEFRGQRSAASHSSGMGSRKLIAYPDLFMWGLQSRWLDIVENYLNQPAAYLGCALRREVPNQKQCGVRLWHKDGEDYKVIKVIIYLSDVGKDHGPFEYIPKKLSPSYIEFSHIDNNIHDPDMAKVVPAGQWRQCLGPRGTVVIGDTVSVFHHASVPRQARYSLTLAYGMSIK